jgi:hypothetical protein
MVTLTGLWLPILVASVVVFFASWIAWMLLPHHKADWKGLDKEDGFIESLRSLGVAPGSYMFPWYSSKDWKDPEKKKRWAAGPHGSLYLWGKTPSLGRNLGCVFVFYLVVGIFVAYLGTLALGPGAEFMKVFQITGTAGIMAYVLGRIPHDIFMQTRCPTVIANIVDGVIYGLLTGVVFGFLWPAA